MEKYVLDTNLFFNMEPGLGIGSKTDVVMKKVTVAIKNLKNKKKAAFYMPPSIIKELKTFFKDRESAFLKDFLFEITIKSPDLSKISFPAEVFYKLIQDIRERSYKGLLTSEDELKKAVLSLVGIKFKDKKESQMRIGVFVKNLRERYRQNTRFGFLDSVADLDLIVLAKEQDAYLVSTDEGVITWGRIFGIKEMEAAMFGKKLTHSE
jgi:RNA ligase partner protein